MRCNRAFWACAAVIASAGAIAHANGVTDVFVGYNARRALVDNPDIRSLWPLERALGLHLYGDAAKADGGTLVRRPVLSLSFALNHALLGPSAAAYQAVNLLIHVATALLLFALARETLRRPGVLASSHSPDAIATVVAVVWVVHPVTTSAVAYAIQRAESLSACLALASLWAFARAVESNGARAWRGGAVTLAALAMATKESVVALPLLVWLYDALFVCDSFREPWRRRRSFYCALFATWVVPLWLVARTLPDVAVDFRPGRTLPYLMAQPTVLLEYLRIALWPHPLHLYSNTGRFLSLPPSTIAATAAIVATIGLATVAATLRRRPIAFLPAVVFLLLAPTSSVVATNDVIQEHRLYLPLAAIVTAVVLGIAMLLQSRSPAGRQRLLPFVGIVGTIALVLGALTHVRNEAYADPFAAFFPADRSMAHGALARHAAARGRSDEAIGRYRDLLDLDDEAFGIGPFERRFHRGRAHNDLGALLTEAGKTDEARQHFAKAIAAPAPLPAAVNNLGVVLCLRGDCAHAISTWERLRTDHGMDPRLLNNLGVALANTGDVAAARGLLERAARTAPRIEVIRKNLDTLGGAHAVTVHRIRDYDDPWLLLSFVAAPSSSS